MDFSRTLFLFMTLLVFSMSPAIADNVYEDWKDGDTGGWQPNTSMTEVEVVDSGGVDGGYLSSFEIGSGFNIVGALNADPAYTGNYASHGYVQISVALKFSSGVPNVAWFRVRYQNPSYNGWYVPLTDDFTNDIWHECVLYFNPTWTDEEAITMGWVQEPSSPSFQETMSDVYTAEVRIQGAGYLVIGMDNFALEDQTVNVEAATWGETKSLYR